jgi:phage shock protein E
VRWPGYCARESALTHSSGEAINFYIMSYTSVSRIVAAVAALVAITAGCSSSGDSASDSTVAATAADAGSAQLLGPAEFAALIAEDEVTVLNVHVPYEGEIVGTDAFVPFDSIRSWAELPEDRAAPIAVYCRSGNMSATAADTLVDIGYINVVDLAGGMNAWVAQGWPLEGS